MKALSIIAEVSDIRLDKYLAEEIELISRSKIKESIVSKDVLVNGEAVKPSFKLAGGETIRVEISDPQPMELESQPILLDIIHEDDDIVVLNKQVGLVVHPGAGNRTGTLVNGLIHHFDQLSSVSGSLRPGIVHRLDKDTSGVIVVAKNDAAHGNIALQFSERTVEKTYLALVWGIPEETEGKIDLPIIRHPKMRTLFTTGEVGRPALTEFRLLEPFEYLSLLELTPRTGRTHQLRVHLSEMGHPIFGDASYGGGESRARGFLPEVTKELSRLAKILNRQALHAMILVFDHPSTGERVTFVAPMADDIAAVIHELEPESIV
ncbi:MAG TPA: RluA family pseudouridine synthase [Candidatus Marinimicrobia bacterium]|nr:RluA family pseudouridine synthase [Candidatus Neomarinimicrobiota bacterium]